jgi:iron complex transport system substrate-binding protein
MRHSRRVIVAALTLSIWSPMSHAQSPTAPSCARIVSLAPSVTELLFAIGLGDHVVGVTRFCRHPEEAKLLPKVGGFYDVGVESLVQLRPEAVISLQEGLDLTPQGAQFRFTFTRVEHRSLGGIKESLRTVGALCGVETAAQRERDRLDRFEQEIKRRTQGVAPLRVMVVVGHVVRGKEASIYISGKDGFYTDILSLLGATNVHSATTIALPTVSHEGISVLNPDAIIEIINADDPKGGADIEGFWAQFPEVAAVKSKKVFAIAEDFASIPSIRYPLLAIRIGKLLYPERFVDVSEQVA